MASTINDLTTTLANALGLPRRMVEDTARRLRETDMLPDDDAPAASEHCAALLLGVMAAREPESSSQRVRLYGALPLDRITRNETFANSRVEYLDVPDDDPVIGVLREFGDSLGEFLSHLIEAHSSAPEISVKPGQIALFGGLGNASAMIFLSILVDGFDIGAAVVFSMASLGGGRMPDDAARARLDTAVSVPAEIFQVLREFLASGSEAPREVALPHDGAGGLQGVQ